MSCFPISFLAMFLVHLIKFNRSPYFIMSNKCWSFWWRGVSQHIYPIRKTCIQEWLWFKTGNDHLHPVISEPKYRIWSLWGPDLISEVENDLPLTENTYKCQSRIFVWEVTDSCWGLKDYSLYSFSDVCGTSGFLVVGGDFSFLSPISHRELVKSSACRLPALISRNVFLRCSDHYSWHSGTG